MNSGVFSTVAGTSQIFTGMLSREAVLSAKSGGEAKMSSGDAERLVGGRLGSSVMKRRIGGVGISGGGGMSGGASKPTLSRLY
jgi:hypothetical protein